MTRSTAADQETADAFATSWNNMGTGSAYTEDQVLDWFLPLRREDVTDLDVLELGCGNASLLVHVAHWGVRVGTGVDLGSSVETARRNVRHGGLEGIVRIVQSDLTTYRHPQGADLTYCIGVLQHLQDPSAGWNAVLENTRKGGRFHCWVYAHEGNALVRWLVDPVRKVCCHLPWWFSKYVAATVLVFPYFIYAKLINRILPPSWTDRLPLGAYARWIAKREFAFFRQVAFDQIVTPRTIYFRRADIETWLADPRVQSGTAYIVMRNGNSWKFGGSRTA